MSKKELKDYFAWFQDILPQRLDELARAVRQTPGFEAWQADFTPASLELLGSGFATQVERRSRTQEEIQEIESRSSFPIEVPGEDLTNRTFSLAMDAGMYLSHVFCPIMKFVALRTRIQKASPLFLLSGASCFTSVIT